MSFEPVAIVGRGCVLPGALSPDALWELVRDGRDLVRSAPEGRWRVSRARIMGTPAAAADRTWSDRGGYVEGFETVFDPRGLGLPAEDLLALDPLVQWLVHVSRRALEEAGPRRGARVGGVFGNLSFPSSSMSRFAERVWLGERLADAAGVTPTDPRNRFMSGLPASLVAQALELDLGAFCLDAACASSLYAIKLACDRLHDGSADLMLAGAVNCADDLFIHVGFCALQAMSKTGQSRPFHQSADGLLPAEGAAVVALKLLSEAQAAGDRIYGVIRGVGLSNDGRSDSLLAPSVEGQIRAMTAAYDRAGLRPEDISLVECHATGTVVGDGAEVRSMARVFEGVRDVPVGSLKSNFGHSVTAAGVSGLLKVLGAMQARVRPPTLHVEEPLPLLAGTPLRLLREAEPWDVRGPRRAAVSAFGFGGNNAHLIVEEPPDSSSHPRPRAATRTPKAQVAVVGLGACVGEGRCLADFERHLFDPAATLRARATSVALPVAGTRCSPRDLAMALPQQPFMLAAAREALAACAMPGQRAGAFVGMGCDPQVARYGAHWRLGDWAQDWGVEDSRWVKQAADAFAPVLESAGVLGTMPNIPANRLNVQYDLQGQGFTVSAEEMSGVRALEIAARAVASGELDFALVGAVDLSCDEVHEAAARGAGDPAVPGDAAVALVLKRVDDARRDGDQILALLDTGSSPEPLEPGAIESRFGKAHAAFGLVQVAAGVLCCARGKKVGGSSWSGQRSVSVAVSALGGQTCRVQLCSEGEESVMVVTKQASEAGALREYPAHRALVMPELPAEQDDGVGLAPPEAPKGVQVMPPAPRLPAVLDGELPTPTSAIRPPAVPSMVTAPVASTPNTAAGAPLHPILEEAAAQQARIARMHREFLETQAAVQQRFLAMREQTIRFGCVPVAQTVAPVPSVPSSIQPRAIKVPPPNPAVPAPAPAVQVPKAAPAAEAVATPRPAPTQAARVAPPPKAAPAPIAEPATFPGPKLDRSGLQVHASGNISEIFGPHFKPQDQYARQVRMPEPPLLLADRLLGIDAKPGSMGTGKLWTETDVQPDAWYLHEGRMPAGVMIESGQADLMLISYLGIDLLNQGERVYRLLGCDLTYHGSLPVVGETLRYEIHVDGHANQGDIRLFFFHYDCRNPATGAPRLSVRGGQAGFFTNEELADSKGILWTPETGEKKENPRLDPPAVVCEHTRFDRTQLESFASGQVRECFGKGFELASTHTRTPKIAGGKMLFLEEVTDFAPQGGPWGRGYLRAVDRLSPDDWFFQGHFKNDPCMPGTLMFEGCLQTMAFYLAAMGYTLDKDGWRFEPVPEETYKLRCRGQATPSSKEVVYELFVEEVVAGPEPILWADLLCTVDGLKAFHCRRMGLRLVPGWPMDSRHDLLPTLRDTQPVATADGFSFGYKSLLACAWGKPSDAFGPMYSVFDGTRRVARLPGPPYHFMSRVSKIEGGAPGSLRVGTMVEVDYDVPADAWYYDANGARTMPYCVLLEAALQPCGWLASYVGSALTTETDLAFRNLDGTGKLLEELPPDIGTIRTRATITNISRSAGMIIESFDVTMFAGERPIYEMKTVFGFFPKEALEAQKGLPVPAGEREQLDAASEEQVSFATPDERWFGRGPKLPAPELRMLDRVSGIWPEGGAKNLGRFRGELDVKPETWFFKAHFFQDPVQPGSLGIEALLQLLQFGMLRLGLADGEYASGRFEPIALDSSLTWKYRGQVRPRNKRITTLIDITSIQEDERGRVATADGSLWVDGLRIYEAKNLAMRIVRDAPEPGPGRGGPGGGSNEEVLDPADPLLRDHRPTWTVPALPLMSMVDRLAAAVAKQAPGKHVVDVENARALRWVPVPAPLKLTTEVKEVGEDEYEATLLAWRDAPRAELSRFEAVASARVRVAEDYPRPEDTPRTTPADAVAVPDPYAAGTLFHGPSFQLLRSLAVGSSGSSASLDVGATPWRGHLNEVLLDAFTHAIPHDGMSRWSEEIASDLVAYPHCVTALRLYAPLPASGTLRCETRFAGFEGSSRFPKVSVQVLQGERIVASLELVEVLFPKGALGSADPLARRAFLRDRTYVPGLRLSESEGGTTRLTDETLRASDWLPGTIAAAYGCASADLVAEVALKEHVAHQAQVHPTTVQADVKEARASCAAEPLTAYRLKVERPRPDEIRVSDERTPHLDIREVRDFWSRRFNIGRWPVEDLFHGLAERFVRRVRLADPDAFRAIRGRGVLFLANHQVGIESLLFSMLASGLTGVCTMTLAKAEHRATWLGRLIQHAFSYPGVTDPGVIAFFARDDREELPRVIAQLGEEIQRGGKSVMVHVEGTRALSCRPQVTKMSGAFLDMAVAIGAPIVPVRFVGGLPVEPLEARLEFPVGMGQQDIWLGRPLMPEELARRTYKDRKELVLGAINGLGPSNAEEQPLPGNPEFARAAEEWSQRTGATAAHAVLFETLRRAPAPSEHIQRLLEGAKTGRMILGSGAEDQWLAELARRLFGDRGSAVSVG